MAGKRLFDIMVAALALLLTSPAWIIIAIGVKISSPGPILYKGVRTGKNGRPFRILKFRTMVINAEKKGGGTTALNDPRIFPLGRVLRKFKLDEVPQLVNVLRGEMSLVGPRPELTQYTDQYSEEERQILSVLPGITDFSSVRFSALDEIVGATNADQVFEQQVLPEKNRLRLEYVRTQSWSTDLKILVGTVHCIGRKLLR